jgi:hypothetical protein
MNPPLSATQSNYLGLPRSAPFKPTGIEEPAGQGPPNPESQHLTIPCRALKVDIDGGDVPSVIGLPLSTLSFC